MNIKRIQENSNIPWITAPSYEEIYSSFFLFFYSLNRIKWHWRIHQIVYTVYRINSIRAVSIRWKWILTFYHVSSRPRQRALWHVANTKAGHKNQLIVRIYMYIPIQTHTHTQACIYITQILCVRDVSLCPQRSPPFIHSGMTIVAAHRVSTWTIPGHVPEPSFILPVRRTVRRIESRHKSQQPAFHIFLPRCRKSRVNSRRYSHVRKVIFCEGVRSQCHPRSIVYHCVFTRRQLITSLRERFFVLFISPFLF